ncbi:MAG: hypothetical protein L0211_13770 [Planctomycetaceae bacterium]|nr:hypothetical protein [Planctomycetaceae bacterium]
MRRGLLCLVVCGGIGLAGCGGEAQPPAAQGQTAGQTPLEATAAEPEVPGVNAVEAAKLPSVQVAVTATPEQVVQTFLDAMKQGDIATKAALLTQKAREETARENFEINPQSAANAQYEVRPAEYLPENPHGAHVTSVWTEAYPDGTITYDVVWVLRRQAEGWRIAGMAIELVPGQPPAFLNFEDAADMAKKYSEAMAASQPPAAEVAAQPIEAAAPGNSRVIER